MGFFLGGVHLSQVHQPRRNAPFTLLVQQRLLHPLEGANRASTAPTELTIRGYVEVRGGCAKLNQCGLKAQHHIAQGSALGILYL